ncbi:MAG: DUF3592 domain-containing protein [Pseudomonadota bacterium]
MKRKLFVCIAILSMPLVFLALPLRWALAYVFGLPMLVLVGTLINGLIYIRHSTLTDGVVAALDALAWHDDDGPVTAFRIRYTFFANGRQFEGGDTAPSTRPPPIGARVRLRYAPDNPADSRIWPDHFWSILIPIAICAVPVAAACWLPPLHFHG